MAFAKLGNYAQAIDDLNNSQLLNKEVAQVGESRQSILIDKRSFLAEMTKYDLIIKSSPNPGAYVKRAALYNSLANYERALADLEISIGLDPNSAEAYHQRGKAYEGLKMKDKAIADFSRFLELARDKDDLIDAKEHLERLGVAR